MVAEPKMKPMLRKKESVRRFKVERRMRAKIHVRPTIPPIVKPIFTAEEERQSIQ